MARFRKASKLLVCATMWLLPSTCYASDVPAAVTETCGVIKQCKLRCEDEAITLIRKVSAGPKYDKGARLYSKTKSSFEGLLVQLEGDAQRLGGEQDPADRYDSKVSEATDDAAKFCNYVGEVSGSKGGLDWKKVAHDLQKELHSWISDIPDPDKEARDAMIKMLRPLHFKSLDELKAQ